MLRPDELEAGVGVCIGWEPVASPLPPASLGMLTLGVMGVVEEDWSPVVSTAMVIGGLASPPNTSRIREG